MITEEAPLLNKVQILKVTSNAFKNKGFIPGKYTNDGDNINPPLSISDFPEGTKSLALTEEDPDAPVRSWTHWIVWDIVPTHLIKEATVPGTQGINDMWQKRMPDLAPIRNAPLFFQSICARQVT